MTSWEQGNLLVSIQYKGIIWQNSNINNLSITMPCQESLSKHLT